MKAPKGQLTLFGKPRLDAEPWDALPTSQGYIANPSFAGLEGRALDEAWLDAGSPLPVPFNCIPLPFSA